MKILWIDDEIEDYAPFIASLSTEHSVSTARSFKEGKDKIGRLLTPDTTADTFDIIVLDVHLDGANRYRAGIEDGLSLIQQIRSKKPTFPIVVLSAVLDKVDLQVIRKLQHISIVDKGNVRPSILNTHLKKLRDEAR